MSATLIEGGPIADGIKEDVRSSVSEMSSPPKLVALLTTDNPGAKYYARSQRKSCEEVGIDYELHDEERTGGLETGEEIKSYIHDLNADDSVSGIILLMPVPEGIDAREVQTEIAPEKDVEGIHPANIGRLFYGDFSLAPCTPHAVVRMLQETGVDLKGKETVVVGHSEIVGKPTLVMLLRSVMESPTITCCHIATRDLAEHTRRAEVLVVAAGKAGLVSGDMIRDDAVVIDVGINRVKVEEDGEEKTRVVGDVDFEEARNVAGAITPVPGGVGLVTTAMLLQNTVECARRGRE
ncbi:MAG: bifunctional 5,10-methylenetetrahydrofolate dehydrogenase/5,10-methenyltetrahydrofolate cyclohydrolase [Planctomycetota bacterium]